MRGICHRFNGQRYEADRDGFQGAQGHDPVQLRPQQRLGARPPAQCRLSDEELEPLTCPEERQLTIETRGEDLRDLLIWIRRVEHSEHPPGVFRGLQEPRDHRRLEGENLPRTLLEVLDITLDMRPLAERGAPGVDFGVRGLRERGQQVGRLGRRTCGRCPRCYFGDRQECRPGLGPRDLGLAYPDPLRELAPGNAATFARAPKFDPETLPLPWLRPHASVWSNHAVFLTPFGGPRHDESPSSIFIMIHYDSSRCTSRADLAYWRQAERAGRWLAGTFPAVRAVSGVCGGTVCGGTVSGRTVSGGAVRMVPAVALWLFTLAALYVALRRSGVYGLVADAQNLIAIYGVLHAAMFAIASRQAIRRRGRRRTRSCRPRD